MQQSRRRTPYLSTRMTGTLKDNYFCKPSSDELIHEGRSWPGMGKHTYYTLKQWQEKYTWSDNSPKTDIRKLTPRPGEDDTTDGYKLSTTITEQTQTISLNEVTRTTLTAKLLPVLSLSNPILPLFLYKL